MASITSTTLPAAGDIAGISAVRSLLDAARFDASHIQQLLGAQSEVIARPADLPVHLRRLTGAGSALATLIRLFVLGVTVDEDVERDLAPLGVDGLQELGLVQTTSEGIRAIVRLVPHDGLVIASDRPGRQVTGDHVAGVHRPSATLANLTVRRPVERALDVGTGNGIQALLAAAHAGSVVATDVNPRALVFAQLNARLNGIDNVEFREGSFLEPVEGEAFDLVVANPPYVISPESELIFRDSGMGRDRVSEELLRSLPAHLAEGAFATVMVSWIQEAGADEADRPRRWLTGSGCDAWILHSTTDDPLETAAAWNRDAGTPDEYAERIDRWLDYYRSEGIGALSYGGIVLRRRSDPNRDRRNWAHSAALPPARLAPAGSHLARMFAAQDLLAEGDDLLDRRFRFAAGAAMIEELGPSDAGWAVTALTLELRDGLGFRAGLDGSTARILSRLGPGEPVRACLAAVARDLEIAEDDLRRAGLDLIRRLLELGFLEQCGEAVPN